MTVIRLYQQLPSLAAGAFVAVFLLCMLLWIRLLNGPVSRLQGWRRHIARAPLLVLIAGFVLYHDFISGHANLFPLWYILLRLGYFAGLIRAGVFPPTYGQEFWSYYRSSALTELAQQIAVWVAAMAVISWLYDRFVRRETGWGRRIHRIVIAAGYLILALWGCIFISAVSRESYVFRTVEDFPGGGRLTLDRGVVWGLQELTGIPIPDVLWLRLPGQVEDRILYCGLCGNRSGLSRRPDSDWCTFVSGWMGDELQGGTLGLTFINTRTGLIRHLRPAHSAFSGVRTADSLDLQNNLALWQEHREPAERESDYRMLIIAETGEITGVVNFGRQMPDDDLTLTAFVPRRSVRLAISGGQTAQEFPCDPASAEIVRPLPPIMLAGHDRSDN